MTYETQIDGALSMAGGAGGPGDRIRATAVFLMTDEPVLAQGMAQLVAGTESLKLSGTCANFAELGSQLAELRPDVVLLALNQDSPAEALHYIRTSASVSKVILWVRSLSTEMAGQAISAGARGVLKRTLPPEFVIQCIHAVDRGELWLEKELADSLKTISSYTVTRREGQVIALIAQGLKNKEIATNLRITEGSVKTYMSKLFAKLKIKDRYELAVFGLRNLAPGVDSMDTRSRAGTQIPLEDSPASFFVERSTPGSNPAFIHAGYQRPGATVPLRNPN